MDDVTIEQAVDRSRPLKLPPRAGFNYVAFVDSSAGRHDVFSACVAHVENGRVIADVVRGVKPPFDPASVATDFAILAKEYGCRTVTGDNFAGEWVAAAFRTAGVEYVRSELTRSELYLESLPLFSRGLVSIPAHEQTLRELRLLERRTTRAGRDSVDHGAGGSGAGGSDDYANALCGALVLAGTQRSSFRVTAADLPNVLGRIAQLQPRRGAYGGRPRQMFFPLPSQLSQPFVAPDKFNRAGESTP